MKVRWRAALPSEAKQALIIDVLERFVPHAESYWRESDLREPRSTSTR